MDRVVDKLQAEWKNLVEAVVIIRKDIRSLKYTHKGKKRPDTAYLRDRLWVEKIRMKPELRYVGLALCMFKGVPYAKIERKTTRKPYAGRIQEVIEKTCGVWIDKARIEMWISGPP